MENAPRPPRAPLAIVCLVLTGGSVLFELVSIGLVAAKGADSPWGGTNAVAIAFWIAGVVVGVLAVVRSRRVLDRVALVLSIVAYPGVGLVIVWAFFMLAAIFLSRVPVPG